MHPFRFPVLCWLATCAAFALGGCGRQSDSYYPLARGWSWAYAVHIKTKSGARKFRYVVENVGEGKLDGHAVAVQRAANGAQRYYRDDASGVLWVGETMPDEKPIVFSPPRIVLPTRPHRRGRTRSTPPRYRVLGRPRDRCTSTSAKS